MSALPQQLLNIDPDAIIRAAKIENFKAGDFELIDLLPKQEEAMRLLTNQEVEEVLYGGAAGGGKAQPLDAKVLTPFGFVEMGSLVPGDLVRCPDGTDSEIIAIHPQGVKDVYEIRTTLGATVRCTLDHLWPIYKMASVGFNAVRNTKYIIDEIASGARVRLKFAKPGYSQYEEFVESVIKVGSEECQCITIDHPDSLYITNDYIVTHNSYLGCEWLLWSALSYPSTRWFIAREELSRIKKSTYATFIKVSKKHKIRIGEDWKFNGQDNYILFSNGSRIDFIDLRYVPRDLLYERLGSFEWTGGWIEEGGEVHYQGFVKVGSRIGRHLNEKDENDKERETPIKRKLLVTCNPKRNWLYRDFYRPWKNGTLEDYRAFIRATIEDNDRVERDYVNHLDRMTGSDRQRLRLGEWEYESDPSRIINNEGIDALFYNSMLPTGRRCITGDIALQGSDLFVLAYWNGFRCEELVYIRKCDAKQVEEAVRAMAERNKVFSMRDICLDTQGIGSWLTAYLKGCVSYVSNKRPKKRKGDKNYATINDQVSFHLANRINEKGVFVDPERIFEYVPKTGKMEAVESVEVWEMINEELQQVKDAGIEDGKVRIVRKDDVKQVLGRSPDFWDNFKCREYLELSGTTYSSF